MSEIEKHRGVGDVCRRGFHEKCPAPAACRCECHGEKAAVVEKYTCTACPESFDRASRLREHERRHARDRLIAPEAPREPSEHDLSGLVPYRRGERRDEHLTCPEPGCGRWFAAAPGLASHRRSHERDRNMASALLDDVPPTAGERAATNGERDDVPRGTDDDGWEPAGTLTLNDDGTQTWEPAPEQVDPEQLRHVVEYDARMAALADDVELAWPHRCAERYVNLLINQLADEPYSDGRSALMDRIERVLGLHPTSEQ